MTSSDPTGIFDSGVGELSVLHEIRRELPHEDLLYVADSGHAPYGDEYGCHHPAGTLLCAHRGDGTLSETGGGTRRAGISPNPGRTVNYRATFARFPT